jgi:hypothetical protein
MLTARLHDTIKTEKEKEKEKSETSLCDDDIIKVRVSEIEKETIKKELEKKRRLLDIKIGKIHCNCLNLAKLEVNINKQSQNYKKNSYTCAQQNCNFYENEEVWT